MRDAAAPEGTTEEVVQGRGWTRKVCETKCGGEFLPSFLLAYSVIADSYPSLVSSFCG